MTGPDSTAVGQPLRRFATSCDSGFKMLLAKHGFAPLQGMRSSGKHLAMRLYRAGDRYVKVTATTDPRDAPARCSVAVGEGSHQFPDGDWNSLELWQLAVNGGPTAPVSAQQYVLRSVAELPPLLQQMSSDLEAAAADFLSGDLRRFRLVRAAVAASRAPYTVWRPAGNDRYVPHEDPVSAALRARYAGEANQSLQSPCVQGVSVTEAVEEELTNVAVEWDRAMVENDPEAIGQFMADDWTIVGPDGSVDTKESFLGLVKSGALTHDVMESHDLQIRVYGDAAVVIARGISGGKFQGQAFYLVERVSSVFVQQSGQWKCVLTHLSLLADR